MAQLHCYVPDNIADKFQHKAKQANLSTSKYLARLIRQEITEEWPDNYFDLFGSWEGELLERPEQDNFENRLELK